MFLLTLAGPGRRGSPGSTHEGGRCSENGPHGGCRRGKRRESGAVSSQAACFLRGSFFEALTGVMVAYCCGVPACSSSTIQMNNTYNEMNWKVVAPSNSWVTRSTRHKQYSHVEGCNLLLLLLLEHMCRRISGKRGQKLFSDPFTTIVKFPACLVHS